MLRSSHASLALVICLVGGQAGLAQAQAKLSQKECSALVTGSNLAKLIDATFDAEKREKAKKALEGVSVQARLGVWCAGDLDKGLTEETSKFCGCLKK